MEVFKRYEKEFEVATETVNKKLKQLTNLVGEQRRVTLQSIDGELVNMRDLISDMKTVAQTSQNSDAMNMRLKTHVQTLEPLKREVQQARYQETPATVRSELFKRQGTDPLENKELDLKESVVQGQKKLLKTSERIQETQRLGAETEKIGQETILDLKYQREALTRARDNVTEIDDNITKARRILGAMARRIATNNLILALIIVLLFAAICIIIWFKWLNPLVHVITPSPPPPQPPSNATHLLNEK
jgi:vesicle transport through interaction with t-SNAREs protein 1